LTEQLGSAVGRLVHIARARLHVHAHDPGADLEPEPELPEPRRLVRQPDGGLLGIATALGLAVLAAVRVHRQARLRAVERRDEGLGLAGCVGRLVVHELHHDLLVPRVGDQQPQLVADLHLVGQLREQRHARQGDHAVPAVALGNARSKGHPLTEDQVWHLRTEERSVDLQQRCYRHTPYIGRSPKEGNPAVDQTARWSVVCTSPPPA
jgi:hypothetical protein